MDKAIEKARASAVLRGLAPEMKRLGFQRDGSRAYQILLDGHACVIWLQKFSHMPAFRVAMTFRPRGSNTQQHLTEFSDSWERRDRKYNFRLHSSEETVSRCIADVVAFVEEIALPWFQQHAGETRIRA